MPEKSKEKENKKIIKNILPFFRLTAFFYGFTPMTTLGSFCMVIKKLNYTNCAFT